MRKRVRGLILLQFVVFSYFTYAIESVINPYYNQGDRSLLNFDQELEPGSFSRLTDQQGSSFSLYTKSDPLSFLGLLPTGAGAVVGLGFGGSHGKERILLLKRSPLDSFEINNQVWEVPRPFSLQSFKGNFQSGSLTVSGGVSAGVDYELSVGATKLKKESEVHSGVKARFAAISGLKGSLKGKVSWAFLHDPSPLFFSSLNQDEFEKAASDYLKSGSAQNLLKQEVVNYLNESVYKKRRKPLSLYKKGNLFIKNKTIRTKSQRDLISRIDSILLFSNPSQKVKEQLKKYRKNLLAYSSVKGKGQAKDFYEVQMKKGTIQGKAYAKIQGTALISQNSTREQIKDKSLRLNSSAHAKNFGRLERLRQQASFEAFFGNKKRYFFQTEDTKILTQSADTKNHNYNHNKKENLLYSRLNLVWTLRNDGTVLPVKEAEISYGTRLDINNLKKIIDDKDFFSTTEGSLFIENISSQLKLEPKVLKNSLQELKQQLKEEAYRLDEKMELSLESTFYKTKKVFPIEKRVGYHYQIESDLREKIERQHKKSPANFILKHLKIKKQQDKTHDAGKSFIFDAQSSNYKLKIRTKKIDRCQSQKEITIMEQSH